MRSIVGYGRLAPVENLSSHLSSFAMGKNLGADCPCGFTFTTPHGEADAIAVVQLHLQRVHGKPNPTREEAKAAIKAR